MAVNLEQELLQAKRRIAELQAENERTNHALDVSIRAFKDLKAENERLRAVVEAAKDKLDKEPTNTDDSLYKALAALETNDDTD